MLKFVAAAAVAAVVVTGMPAVSEAGQERTRDCRICKAMSDFRAKMSERLARPAPVAVRTERRVFEWPKIKLPPRDPLFKLAPREPRPVVVYKPRERAPLFKLCERASR